MTLHISIWVTTHLGSCLWASYILLGGGWGWYTALGGAGNGAGRVLGPPITLFGWIGRAGQQGMGGMGLNGRKWSDYVI